MNADMHHPKLAKVDDYEYFSVVKIVENDESEICLYVRLAPKEAQAAADALNALFAVKGE
jgi:hypothetical protein